MPVLVPVSTPWPPTGSGGVQTFVHALSQVAEDVDIDLRILGVGGRESRVGAVSYTPVAAATDSEFEYARALRGAVRRNPSLLPAGGVVLANAEHYVWALKHESVPIVLVAHGVISETLPARRGRMYAWLFKRSVEGPAVRRVSKIVAVSDRVRRYYSSMYPEDSVGKLVKVTMGVLLEKFDGRPYEAPELPKGVDQSVPILLFVGRLSPEKNLSLFVSSCDALLADGSRFAALVVGDGPEAPTLKALQQARPWLHWVPGVPHDRLIDLMAVSNVLAICSSYEGLPTVLLEAIASGLPVVSTDVGRSRELLHPPVGIIADRFPGAFADGFRRLMVVDRKDVRAAANALRPAIDFRSTARAVVEALRAAQAEEERAAR